MRKLQAIGFALGAVFSVGTTASPAVAHDITSADITSSIVSGSLCSSFSPAACTVVLSKAGSVTLGGSSLTFGLTPNPYLSATVFGSDSVGLGNPVNTVGLLSGIKSNGWDTPYHAATAEYFVEVSGPESAAIPVDLSYSLNTFASANIIADAGVFVDPSAGHNVYGVTDDQIGTNIYDNGGLTPSSRKGTLTTRVPSAKIFDVGMYVEISDPSNQGGYANVTVDPVLSIDPSFAAVDPNYLTDYQIVLSPGVGNSAVPEPAAWFMLLLGFFGAGVAARGSRPKAYVS